MMKNDPRARPQRRQSAVARGILALVLVGLLAVPIAVQAELKATELAYTWDISAENWSWEWGHATVMFDGGWIPLLHQVRFDDLEERDLEPGEPDICGDGITHLYSGWIEYGLPHLDTDPEDALGFLSSDRNPDPEVTDWVLIDCDLNLNTIWDRDDLTVPPENLTSTLTTCDVWDEEEEDQLCWLPPYDEDEENPEYPDYIGQTWHDLEMNPPSATSGHVKTELSTMLIINLDTDCDGDLDTDDAEGALDLKAVAESTGLCVFFWVETPFYEVGQDEWSFPLPVRITDADGAKTLMLSPTAVELASFSAEPQGRDVLVSWETASEIDNAGFNVYRSDAGGERVRLNDWLIPSQNPGSTMGSSYQFVDRSAEPDTAYQYWLEDIDMEGAAAMNGPLAVQTPRQRFLPSRPRPAPIPQSR